VFAGRFRAREQIVVTHRSRSLLRLFPIAIAIVHLVHPSGTPARWEHLT